MAFPTQLEKKMRKSNFEEVFWCSRIKENRNLEFGEGGEIGKDDDDAGADDDDNDEDDDDDDDDVEEEDHNDDDDDDEDDL